MAIKAMELECQLESGTRMCTWMSESGYGENRCLLIYQRDKLRLPHAFSGQITHSGGGRIRPAFVAGFAPLYNFAWNRQLLEA